MKRALAFFGAFNPPTIAHLALAEFAMKAVGEDCVVFVPSKTAYIEDEQGKSYAFSDGERLDMLRAAAAKRPWMTVSDCELRAERQPRTYDTLCRLRDAGLQARLLMGSDKLPELEHGWRHVEEICRDFGIVCLTRGADACAQLIAEDAYLRGLSPYIRVLETPAQLHDVSSTAVRERLRQVRVLQSQIQAMVPNEILPLLITGGNDDET